MKFDMPVPKDDYESVRYFRISEALEESGIPFDKCFELDIEKGIILETIEANVGLDSLNRMFGIGCVATPPSIKYHSGNNGNKMSYVRGLHSHIDRGSLFVNGVADMRKIAKVLSDKGNYSETVSVYAKDVRTPATVFSDSEGWRFRIRDCEADGHDLEQKGIYLKDAVSLALDFYKSNNL
jgi:hypothetical protein